MALPETDLHRIRLWARERVPEHLWDELKVEADVSERHDDVVEVLNGGNLDVIDQL